MIELIKDSKEKADEKAIKAGGRKLNNGVPRIAWNTIATALSLSRNLWSKSCRK